MKNFKDFKVNEDSTSKAHPDEELSLETAMDVVNKHIQEAVREYQDMNGVEYGDISPDNNRKLEEVKDNLSLIMYESWGKGHNGYWPTSKNA